MQLNFKITLSVDAIEGRTQEELTAAALELIKTKWIFEAFDMVDYNSLTITGIT